VEDGPAFSPEAAERRWRDLYELFDAAFDG
jgi:hypothetical protein